MKTIKRLSLALLMFACGEASEDTGDNGWFWLESESGAVQPATADDIAEAEQELAAAAQNASAEPDSEFGVLEQAFSAATRYGVFTGTSTPCTGNWGTTNTCVVPADKTLKFINALLCSSSVNTAGTDGSESAQPEGPCSAPKPTPWPAPGR